MLCVQIVEVGHEGRHVRLDGEGEPPFAHLHVDGRGGREILVLVDDVTDIRQFDDGLKGTTMRWFS